LSILEHRPYPKIAKRADGSRPAPGGIWVATEKIHGANLVVATNGAADAIGKRKAWLTHDEPFFGWQLLRNNLVTAARAIRASLQEEGVVRLYGEIFGGSYPHPEVIEVPGMLPVQTGIWYAPDIRFALFDIALDRGADVELLAHSEVETLAQAHGLLVAPLLGRGTRADLEALPTRFPSRVASALGLPPIDGNVAEGFVLKPDARAGLERYVTKWKIPELDDARFGDGMPFDANAVLDPRSLLRFAEAMVNPARIASARSKVGTASVAIEEEVVLDVLIDLEAAFPRSFQNLDPNDEEALRKTLSERARALTTG